MNKFSRIFQLLISLFIFLISISAFPQKSIAQDNGNDSVTVRIDAPNPVIYEGEDGIFEISVIRPPSTSEKVYVFFRLNFSGDFFFGTPESQETTLEFAPNDTSKIHKFETEKDNQFEQDGSVEAIVGILTNNILDIFNLKSAQIDVLNEVAEEKLVSNVHKDVIPEVAKAVNTSVFNAISNRIDQYPEQTSASKNFRLLNSTTEIKNISVNSNSHNLEPLIDDLSYGFSVTHGNNLPPPFYAWGKGEYQQISGKNENSRIDWDGRVIGGHIGVDTTLISTFIGGLLTTYTSHNLDFMSENQDYNGQSFHKMVSFFPYLGWNTRNKKFNIWTSAGFGLGQVDLETKFQKGCEDDKDIDCLYTDSSLLAAAIGSKVKLFATDLFNGETELSINSGVSGSRFAIESDSTEEEEIIVRGDEFHNFQARLNVENSTQIPISTNYKLNPKITLGGRWDGGHGAEGYGIDIGGSLGLQANWGAIEGFGNYLIVHNNNTIDEWGAGGQIKFDAGLNQLGSILNFSLNTGTNYTFSNRSSNIWDSQYLTQNLADTDNNSDNYQLTSEIGYGFAVGSEVGILTPFAAIDFSANNHNSLHYGGKYSLATNVNVEAKTTSRLKPNMDSSQDYSITGSIRW